MRISFVVYDGYFEKCSKMVNLVINHYDADNFICMDKERIEGFSKAFESGEILRWEIPKAEKESTRKL